MIGTIVSPGSSSAESATAVYNAHPYFSNRSPAWVTIWSRGIGPNTATLRLAPVRPSVVMNTSGARLQRADTGLTASSYMNLRCSAVTVYEGWDVRTRMARSDAPARVSAARLPLP